MKTAYVVAVAVLTLGSFTMTSIATDRLVPSQYPNIQSAVDAAASGDVIWVSPGVYTSTQAGFVVNMRGKAVTLSSLDPLNPDVVASTIIDGQLGRRGISCHTSESFSTSIRGLTIANGYTVPFDYDGSGSITYEEAWGAGIYCRNSSVLVDRCIFRNGLGYSSLIGNAASGYGSAIALQNSSTRFTNCSFISNTGGYYPIAVSVSGYSTMPRFTDCLIASNQGLGFLIGNGPTTIIERCVVRNNSGGGITCNYTAPTQILDCQVLDNSDTGVRCGYNSISIVGSTIRGNFTGVNGSTNGSIDIQDSVICGNSGSEATGTWVDLGGNLISESCPLQCPADIVLDGEVDAIDLAAVLGAWGTSGGPFDADITNDGIVGGADLTMLFSGWGSCPN